MFDGPSAAAARSSDPSDTPGGGLQPKHHQTKKGPINNQYHGYSPTRSKYIRGRTYSVYTKSSPACWLRGRLSCCSLRRAPSSLGTGPARSKSEIRDSVHGEGQKPRAQLACFIESCIQYAGRTQDASLNHKRTPQRENCDASPQIKGYLLLGGWR